MHHQTTRALYEFYPLTDKNDFFAAYLYLRYPEHFIYHANLASGLPAQEPAEKVAATLGLSTKTVETYRSRVLHKLCLRNDVEICRFAYRNGLLDGTAAESVQEGRRART